MPSPSQYLLRGDIPSRLLLRAAVHTALFGVASWILINCIWAEIMLMVQSLPEGYSISAWLILFVGCGNVGPVLYVNWPEGWQLYGLATHIQFLLAAAVTIAGLYAVFWDHTVDIDGTDHSICLFLLVFAGNVVSTLMAVSFYPFVGQLPRRCTTALGVGEAFSGIVPSVLALAQVRSISLRSLDIRGERPPPPPHQALSDTSLAQLLNGLSSLWPLLPCDSPPFGLSSRATLVRLSLPLSRQMPFSLPILTPYCPTLASRL